MFWAKVYRTRCRENSELENRNAKIVFPAESGSHSAPGDRGMNLGRAQAAGQAMANRVKADESESEKLSGIWRPSKKYPLSGFFPD